MMDDERVFSALSFSLHIFVVEDDESWAGSIEPSTIPAENKFQGRKVAWLQAREHNGGWIHHSGHF